MRTTLLSVAVFVLLVVPGSRAELVEAVRDLRTSIPTRLETSRALLAKGASVNERDAEGNTALMWAAAEPGQSDLVRLLLDRGADVNARNKQGYTALMFAAGSQLEFEFGSVAILTDASGDCGIVQLLLAAGADPNAKAIDGDSALAVAVKEGHIEIVRLLRKAGARVAYTGNPATDLIRAVEVSDVEKVKTLIQQGTPARSTSAALLVASWNGDVDLVRLLLAHGASANAKDKAGTALMRAARMGNSSVVDLLLGAGANPNFRNDNGTALYLAAEEGHADVVQELLRSGADVNAGHRFGGSPLVAAADQGHLSIVKILLAAGADPHATDSSNENALFRATVFSHTNVIQFLLRAGFTPNTMNEEGDTPLLIAVRSKDLDITRLFLNAGADANLCSGGDTPLMEASQAHNPAGISLLLQAGAKVNARGRNGSTALHRAAYYGCSECITALLGAKPDLDARDDLGLTPLMYAVEGGFNSSGPDDAADYPAYYDVVRTLVEAGADLNAQAGGHSVLWFATGNTNPNNERTIRFLLKAGAKE